MAENIEVMRQISTQGSIEYATGTTNCWMSWAVWHKPTGFRISRRSDLPCQLNPAQQQPYWNALLQRILADTPDQKQLNSFYWGPVEEGQAPSVFSTRLMQAAFYSPQWDRRRGVLVQSPKAQPNQWVQGVINQNLVFAELISVFSQHRLQLQVDAVEKVFIQKTTIANQAAMLPYSAMAIDFKISPML